MSAWLRLIAWWQAWATRRLQRRLFTVRFGHRSQGRWLPHTRVSPSTCIEHPERLRLADHVYIGHFNLIEASGGIEIGEGVQVSNHVSIVTHSSHRSARLLGRAFVHWPEGVPPALTPEAEPERDWISGRPLPPAPAHPPGWIGGPVVIGPYCFIGPHSLIEANTRLGRGCIVCAGSQVRGDYAEFSILEGAPARVIGDSRRADRSLLHRHPELADLYAAWANDDAARG